MSRLVERIKIGFIGQTGVGKTHFLHNFLFGGRAHKPITPTVAVEFYQRIISIDQQEIALRIWDSSGQQKYRPIVGFHLRQCQVIILMYDLTDIETFRELQSWIYLLKKDGLDLLNKKLLVIGNKLDIVFKDAGKRQVKYEQVKQFLIKQGLSTDDIYEVSSKTPNGQDETYIQDILQQILRQILQERSAQELSSMRVKLGKEGILATEQDEHAPSEQYCGECNIY